ncbi:hypothetical protein [Tranquillimonas alkanivorans]|uniref:Uncharacterized protein n=1 Tax=Tranquillimonas alkanivorans TaxID=441119 RepID=A0A1I5PRF7_9RHOB|nr:hypothetical protein [Tranquillimonas alkanivorans]SFP36589.1 hypothetical protein SAMN04488047_105218 [Tranquillimonas alkanivorans]
MIIVVGLLVAFVLLLVFAPRGTRNCRWRERRSFDRDGERYFHCAYCGAETWKEGDAPPKRCLRDAGE